MAEREISGWVKQVLELGPTLIFFVIYMWIRDDSFVIAGTTYTGFIVAALVFGALVLYRRVAPHYYALWSEVNAEIVAKQRGGSAA